MPVSHVCLHVCDSYRQPEPISSDILDNMKMVQFVGYAPKPVGLHRNQCPYQLSKYQSSSKKTEPESPMMRGTHNYLKHCHLFEIYEIRIEWREAKRVLYLSFASAFYLSLNTFMQMKVAVFKCFIVFCTY